MTSESHYTFGDGDVAQDRLRLLAEVYEPSTRELLGRLAPSALHGPGARVDLGCGAGFTTALLCELPGEAEVFGVDRSARLLEAARSRLARSASLVEHDVTAPPLPVPPARLLYARFLLTHLRDVPRVLVGWRSAVLPGGYIVLEENASMTSEHPSLRRYYALVERMQAHYGQAMFVGRSLDLAATIAGLVTVESRVVELQLPAARMARLHAMNIQTWKDDPFARSSFDAADIAELSARLGAIAAGAEPSSVVTCGIRQLVLRRDDAGSSAANANANATNATQSPAR
jgi:SAM-dependent methyltransferase